MAQVQVFQDQYQKFSALKIENSNRITHLHIFIGTSQAYKSQPNIQNYFINLNSHSLKFYFWFDTIHIHGQFKEILSQIIEQGVSDN